jgi:hypothetical protein
MAIFAVSKSTISPFLFLIFCVIAMSFARLTELVNGYFFDAFLPLNTEFLVYPFNMEKLGICVPGFCAQESRKYFLKIATHFLWSFFFVLGFIHANDP